MIRKSQERIPLFAICALSIVAAPLALAQEQSKLDDQAVMVKGYDDDFIEQIGPEATLVPHESHAVERAPNVEVATEFSSQWKRLREVERTLLDLTFNFLMQCNSRDELSDAEDRRCSKTASEIDSGLKRADSLRNWLSQRAEHAVATLRFGHASLKKGLPAQLSGDFVEPTKLPEAAPKSERPHKRAIM